MKFKNLFWIIFISFFAVSSCGKKGALEKPETYKRPSFDNVIDD